MKLYTPLLNLFFPRFCVGCQRESHWLCKECKDLIHLTQEQTCPQCRNYSTNNQLCYNCKRDSPLKGIIWALNYSNPLVEKLIHLFKYKFVQDISKTLAQFLTKRIETLRLAKKKITSKKSIIIPIPLHSTRLRWRGFNQAQLLAEEISRSLNRKEALFPNIIQKIKNTPPQTELTKKERIKNLQDTFSAQYNPDLTNKYIFLIDDVATTLSTFKETSNALLKSHNRPKEIWGLAIAKS